MIEVHVEGRIEQGRLAEFGVGVERYRDYLRKNDYVVPRVLHALSGEMNTIRLVYSYPDLNAYHLHEAATIDDPGYGEAASGMSFVDGTLQYTIFSPYHDEAE